jgi:ferric-dicitrate binding protein FerR (iron transport regulator)
MFRLNVVMLTLMTVGATAFAQYAPPARPGTLSAVEGQASIEGRALSSRSAGTVGLEAGHVLATANGKAEVLLTPGAFLRIGAESTLEMVSPDALHPEVRLTRGHAELEVDEIAPENRLLVDLPGGQTQLLERGLYSFDADGGLVRVFVGKAAVYPGADLSTDIHPIDVKGGHELTLASAGSTPKRFDKDRAEDDLYRWGSMRSQYLGEEYAGGGGYYPGYYPGYYSGWYAGGGPYWSPYGYGFYSPYAFYGGGFYYGGWGGGFRGGVHPGGRR